MDSSSPVDSKWYKTISYNIVYNVELFFNCLGQEIGKRPIKVIIACIFLTLVSTLGFLRFHQEKNPIKLWIPVESNFMKDTEWLMNTFKQALRPQILLAQSDDVLTPKVLQELNVINTQVTSKSVEGTKWADICFKIPMVDVRLATMFEKSQPIDSNFDPSVNLDTNLFCSLIETFKPGCYAENLLELWHYNDQELQNITKQDVINKLSETKISPITGHPVDYEHLLGDIVWNSTGHIIAAKTLLSIWNVDVNFTAVDMDVVGNDLGTADWATEPVLNWEKQFLSIMENAQNKSSHSELYYISSRSFSDISGATMLNDIPQLAIGVILMIIYIQFAISKFNCIDARVMMGCLGLTSIGMAFIMACGICSLLGVFYGPVHTSLPFLLMGLGVDDMFIIAASWDRLPLQEKKLPLPERIGLMLQHAGVSITVTSLTDFVAFLVGSFTILPSLKSFCIYAAVGVLTTYMFVATFFVACFTLDQTRIESQRNCLAPCYQHRKYEKNDCSQKQMMKQTFLFIYQKIILTTPGKILVIIIAIACTGIGLSSTVQMRQKFDPMWFIPDNYYLQKYVDVRKVHYPNMGFEARIFMGQLNYAEEYQKIKMLKSKLDNTTDILQVTGSWIEPFQQFIEKNFHKDINVEKLTEDEWNNYLSKFLFSPTGAKYQGNFKFEQNLECGLPAKKIIASSIDFRFHSFQEPEEYLPAMNLVYKIANTANFTTGDRFVTAWGRVFGNWIPDQILEKELTRNVALAFICVMLCTFVLIANVSVCFWICVCVIATMLNVVGFMHIWGMTIDVVSSIALTLATGLCVDYAAHVGYTFLTIPGQFKNERILETVTTIGAAVLHGGLSTLLALSMLGTSEAYGYKVFFKTFLLVVIFGQFFGLILLPVILSTIGPKPHKNHRYIRTNEFSS